MISDEQAIEFARRAIEGKVEPHSDAQPKVEAKGNELVVEWVRPADPRRRGPDYEAQVRLDAETGRVLGLLGGS
jgi:hypothetical protein